jgi:hypothetical protein
VTTDRSDTVSSGTASTDKELSPAAKEIAASIGKTIGEGLTAMAKALKRQASRPGGDD